MNVKRLPLPKPEMVTGNRSRTTTSLLRASKLCSFLCLLQIPELSIADNRVWKTLTEGPMSWVPSRASPSSPHHRDSSLILSAGRRKTQAYCTTDAKNTGLWGKPLYPGHAKGTPIYGDELCMRVRSSTYIDEDLISKRQGMQIWECSPLGVYYPEAKQAFRMIEYLGSNV